MLGCRVGDPFISTLLQSNVGMNQGILRGKLGLFLTPVFNAMEQQPYWRSCIEMSYCTFGFDVVIRRDLRALLLLLDSVRDNHYARESVHKGLFLGLATKKSGGTITLLHT